MKYLILAVSLSMLVGCNQEVDFDRVTSLVEKCGDSGPSTVRTLTSTLVIVCNDGTQVSNFLKQ